MIAEHRGTGRTTRMLQVMPKDAIVVVANQPCAQHCKDLLRKHTDLDPKRVMFLTLQAVADGRLRGNTRPVVVDHHAWDVATTRQLDELYVALSRLERTA